MSVADSLKIGKSSTYRPAHALLDTGRPERSRGIKYFFRRGWPIPAAFATGIGILSLVVGSLGVIPGFSIFNNTQSPANPLSASSGTLTLSLGSTTSFTQTVSDMAPGDYFEQPITLTNAGNVGIATVNLETSISSLSPSTGPLFAGDSSSEGLQVFGQSCSVAWTASSTTPTTYTCSGTETTLFGYPETVPYTGAPPSGSAGYVSSSYNTNDTTVLASSTNNPDGPALSLPTFKNSEGVTEVLGPSGSSNDAAYVLLTSYLPTTADNNFQTNSADVTYTFTAVQRAGEAK